MARCYCILKKKEGDSLTPYRCSTAIRGENKGGQLLNYKNKETLTPRPAPPTYSALSFPPSRTVWAMQFCGLSYKQQLPVQNHAVGASLAAAIACRVAAVRAFFSSTPLLTCLFSHPHYYTIQLLPLPQLHPASSRTSLCLT